MARISGIDLPRDKRIEIALTYIYGIGRKTATDICAATGVDPDVRVRDLSEDDAAKLREYIDHNCCLLYTSSPQGVHRAGFNSQQAGGRGNGYPQAYAEGR